MAQIKVWTARAAVNTIAAAAFLLGLAGAAHAQANVNEFSPFEQARNKQIGEICFPLFRAARYSNASANFLTDCINEGFDISNRLWKMQDKRPFLNIPKGHLAQYSGPVIAMPSCQFALAACPINGECLWREQVEMLIRQSDECVFPDQEHAK